jgi:hypothetical protein
VLALRGNAPRLQRTTLQASRRTEFILRRQRALSAPFAIALIAAPFRARSTEGITIQTSLQIGKYLVSPMSRHAEGGGFAAAVSIRSGRGSMTHDRVMRFVPMFDTRDQAERFATQQAVAWIERPAASPTDPFIAPGAA